MRQDPASMTDEALLAAIGRSAPAAPRAAQAAPRAAPAAPINPQAMSDAELMRALGRPAPAAPAAPRRAPTGGGRQPAPAPAPAAPAAAPVDEYDTPMIRNVQRTAEGTTFTMVPLGPEDTPESLTASGRYFNPTTNAWEFPRGLEDVEVQGGVEGLPMNRPNSPTENLILGRPQQGSLLDQAVAGARRNPFLGTIMGLGVGGAAGVNDLVGNAARLGGNAMSYIPGMGDLGRGISQNASEFLAAVNQRADAERNNAGLGGAVETARFATQTAGLGGATNLAGQAISRTGQGINALAPRAAGVGNAMTDFGQLVRAGGFGPSAVRPPLAGQAPSFGERVLNTGSRIIAGAGAGVGQAALLDQDVGQGALFGGAMPVLARPAKWLVNATTNLLTNAARRGEGAAANIITDAMGADAERIITALQNAREGDTVRQALVRAGIDNSVIQAVGDAAERVGIIGQDDYFGAVSRGQEAARRATVASAAGGDVQAASDAAARAARAQATGAAGEVRERALRAANASGQLDISAIADDLMARVDRPGIGADPAQTRIYSNLAARLRALADRGGGVIDAENLNVVRQIGINNEVARQLNRVTPAGATAAPQAAQVARELGLVRAAIDDAIQEAGGAEWGQYLTQFSSAAQEAQRRALAGVARDTYLDSPSAFASLVEGRDRRPVEAIFGQTGDFNVAMGGNEGVSRMPALAGVAEDIRVDELAAELASQPGARDTALQLLAPPGNARADRNILRALAGATPKVGTAMAFGDAVAALRLPPRTREALNRAFRNGETFGQILERIPAPQRWQAERNLMNPAFWSGVTGAGVNAMTGNGEQPANTMSPPPQ